MSINLILNILIALKAISFAIALSSLKSFCDLLTNCLISILNGIDNLGRGSVSQLTVFTHRSLFLDLISVLEIATTISTSLLSMDLILSLSPPFSMNDTASMNALNLSVTSSP
ncbi:MAG: hypothetical protein QW101_07375 [Ignisphaera sp.]|uniref:Uncharacterized protein n=1 Tax=Ignisphaera aggregans TaxID=334771 RepID=A0A7J3N0M3_9CREN